MDKSKEFNEMILRNFLNALQRLKDDKIIRGKATFCKRYEINRLNFYKLEQGKSGVVQPSWLYNLVVDYKVEPMFLLTGEGTFYQKKWDAKKVKKLQITCNHETPLPKQTENQIVTD